MAYSYKLIKHIATLSETQYGSKQVNIISHNNAAPKMDIRNWENNEKMTVRGVTLDEHEWQALGACFDKKDTEGMLQNELRILELWQKDNNIDNINLGPEGKIEFETSADNSEFLYYVTLKLDKRKKEIYTDFLNSSNKYIAENELYANVYIDCVEGEEFLNIVGKIPFQFGKTEEMLDALSDFLNDHADSIDEIKAKEIKVLNFKDIIVIGDRLACVHSNHKKEELLVAVDFRHKDGTMYRVETKACYCHECNLYFMRNHDYQMMKIRANNSIMLCREETEERYLRNPNLDFELNDESILHKFGYNVSDGLSDKERQDILAIFIDKKMLSKENIAWRLSEYIKKRMYDKQKFQNAIDKWNRDRDFVLDYDVNNRNIVKPRKIIVIKYKPSK